MLTCALMQLFVCTGDHFVLSSPIVALLCSVFSACHLSCWSMFTVFVVFLHPLVHHIFNTHAEDSGICSNASCSKPTADTDSCSMLSSSLLTFLEVSTLVIFNFLCFQCIELWQDGENDELDISVKVYAKKDSHMVSAPYTFCWASELWLISRHL